VSDFVRRKHIAGGFEASAIRLKPNFVRDVARRDGPGEYFLYLGRLAPEKDLAILIDAWRPDLGRLVVAGDGPDEARLRAAGSKRGIEFAGALPPDEAMQVLAKARALVVPSKSFEGMPRAVLEAYAAGVPVLASDIGALPEVVDADETGLLVAPSAEAWSQALERLTNDREAGRLGRGARLRWETTYSPERNRAALIGIYEDALTERRGRARRAPRLHAGRPRPDARPVDDERRARPPAP
jgi:glycosyltransferase involved in cell wall biosynthesis